MTVILATMAACWAGIRSLRGVRWNLDAKSIDNVELLHVVIHVVEEETLREEE